MKHILAPKNTQLCGVNLANSGAIACNVRLDLYIFRSNPCAPEFISTSLEGEGL